MFKLNTILEYFKNKNNKTTDQKAEEDSDEYLSNSSDECPRCGKNESECICVERDSASTVTMHRFKN